jgi:iron(III) transport system ATP-binding protein
MTPVLELEHVHARIGELPIVRDITFALKEGAIGCLLGASGCGKTTLLRTIAGFVQPVQGEIRIDGARVAAENFGVPPERRRVGMVFQDFALFPHLTVAANIGFGLARLHRPARTARIAEVADLLEIGTFLESWPHELSGGQQQRVALARAIAPRPRVLLLDEPFANLDVDLREQLARELRRVLKHDRITAVLVTHNQIEAFAMADEIGVIRDGTLLQWDSSFNVYHQPVCAYVADFVGEGVFLPGKVVDDCSVEIELGVIHGGGGHGRRSGESVLVLIRPDDIIHDDGSGLRATVLDRAFRGAEFLYTLGLESGARLLSLVPSHHDHAVGGAVGIRLEIDHLVTFPEEQVHQIRRFGDGSRDGTFDR